MRRFTALFAGAAVLLTMAACGGGGGGDSAAFCDDLEALSDQVADGDLTSDRGLEDAVDRVNSLLESASDDQEDPVREVGELLVDAEPDEADDTADDIQDELGDIAEDECDLDPDEFAVGPEDTTTTTEPDDDTTTSSEPDDDTTITTAGGGGGGGGEIIRDPNSPEVNGRDPVPADLEQDGDFPALADACFAGDPGACDTLFATTPVGSVAEAYGSTCAGRVDEGTSGGCSDLILAPVAVPADVTDPNGQACFEGSMVACDDQFNAAEAGSPDQLYGGLCGGRVRNTTAFCVDVFGEQAFR